MSPKIIKSLKNVFSLSSRVTKGLIDIIALLNFRDTKSQSSQSIITAALRTVYKHSIINRLYGGLALLCATATLLFLLGATCVHFLLRFPVSLAAFSFFSLMVLSFVFFKTVLIPLVSLLNREKIALFIEQKHPSFNNSLISSVQFIWGKSPVKRLGYSQHMISLLIDDTAQQIRKLDINKVVSKLFLRTSSIILIASLLVFSIVCAFSRSLIDTNIPLFFNYLAFHKGPDEADSGVYSGPIIGDITIQYRYPLYSGLPKKTVYNTSGDVQALKGSEVQISAISDRQLTSAEIILGDSTKIPCKIENRKIIKGILPVLENGSYVFETVDSQGRTSKDVTTHTIQVEPDQFPEISIRSPAMDTTVNEKDSVKLKYTAKDDFGISEISLVFEHGNETEAKPLCNFSKKKIQYNGAYTWSLSELRLQPDDRVAYHLEAKDNDSISGPKTGTTKTYYLEIYSSRKKHQELIALQEELLREMLYLLAEDLMKRCDDEKCTSKDYLLMTQEGIRERAEKAIRLFTDVLVGMQDDTMANYSVYYALENMKNTLRDVAEKKQSSMKQSLYALETDFVPISVLVPLQIIQDEEVEDVETIIIFLKDLIQKQKIEEVMDTGKTLIQSQNSIEKLLEELRNTENPDLNDKVFLELRNLEETIQQMMQQLTGMVQEEHLDEFLNEDALKGIEQKDLMKELAAMRTAFEKGDMESALEAAKKLLSSLQDMMENMSSSAKNLADSSYSDMLQKTNQLLDKLSELENAESTLTENTEKLKKNVQHRNSESTKDTLQSFFEKQERRIEKIEQDLSETKGILSENKLLQEYLQVNRDIDLVRQEKLPMVNRFDELFSGNQDEGAQQDESDNWAELTSKYVELNRRINKDPFEKSLLAMSGEMSKAEETRSHLEEMVKGWDIKESLDLAKNLSSQLNSWNERLLNNREHGIADKEDQHVAEVVDDATDLTLQIVKDLESMMQFYEERQFAGLTREEQDILQKYAERQKELQEETEDIMEMAEAFSRQNPFLDDTADRQLEMASESMGSARGKLEKQNMPGAVIDERESLYRIANAKKGMENTKEQIMKGMMGEGLPMPFRGRTDEGQFASTAEKVEIPTEDAYKVPKEFRQDILDALKEGLPEKYQNLNKDYYQRLVD
ncbi:MAG: hypothetical protein MRJ65_09645 [Candidatus Brocadiaceae bacterium]|nr:hypothetical protein [Candidatus Brocadiaceae bacterium]